MPYGEFVSRWQIALEILGCEERGSSTTYYCRLTRPAGGGHLELEGTLEQATAPTAVDAMLHFGTAAQVVDVLHERCPERLRREARALREFLGRDAFAELLGLIVPVHDPPFAAALHA